MMKQDKQKLNKSNFGCIEVMILVIFTCLLSLSFGCFLGHKTTTVKEAKSDKYINKFIENYNYINNKYYKKIDKEKLVDSAVKGMVESLGDDYSNFMDQAESNSFDAGLNGGYEGLGISIALDKDNNIVVIRVIDDSPALKAGVKTFDIVKNVNGVSTKGMEPKEITKMVQTSKSKKFTLTVNRDGKEMNIAVIRESITLKSVDFRMIEKGSKKIGYIYIDIFALNTNDQFKKALKDLETQKMDSLIIDVRDNGGGHLVAAKQIISNLLDQSHVIYQTETKGKKVKTYSDGKVTKKYPILFLTNKNTASGSEVLVAALKENVGSVSVGTKTYGKGTVQELVGLSTGSQYKVTVKKWLTPKENWIDKKGLEPNINVVLSEEYNKNPTYENDNQLSTALEYLKDK